MPFKFRIAVQTDDIRFYHKILNTIKGSRLKATFFTSDQKVPLHKYDLVIKSSEEAIDFFDPQFISLNYEQIDVDLVPRVIGIIARKNTPKFKTLIVGIDPGERIGLAAICDGMLLSAQTSRLDKLIKKIQNYVLIFPSELIIIRIGDQPSFSSHVIFNKLFTAFKEIEKITIEIVDEAYTSQKTLLTQFTTGNDEIAAFTIAQREGKTARYMVRNEIPVGRIKEIQRWSRELSENSISLDFELAKSVALGEITLENAIKQKESQIEARKNE